MTLKLVSLNIWNGGRIYQPMLDFLVKEQADIYFLQEVFQSEVKGLEPRFYSYQNIKDTLKLPYSHFAPTFLEDVEGQVRGEVVEGNAVFSRFPLEEVAVVFYDLPFQKRVAGTRDFENIPRNLQHLTAQVGQRKLHLLNTHGIWGEDGLDNQRRIKMGQTIAEEVESHRPAVLAGDFNVTPKTQTIAQIEEKLTNVFEDEFDSTFNLQRKDLQKNPGYATAVVDMMFVSSDINLVEHYSPQVDISDHLPLVARLEIPE